MELRFLGTGPAQAIPRALHRDPLCLAAGPGTKSRRTRSAALVSTRDAAVLVDAGPDIRAQLDLAMPARIDAVLLTHGHADAASGLRRLDRWCAEHLASRGPCVLCDKVTRARLESRFPRLAKLAFATLEHFVELQVRGLRVTRFPVRHARDRRFPTSGYLFTSPHCEPIAYASDFYALGPRAARLLDGIHTFVVDAAAYFGHRIPTHSTTDAAIRLGRRLRVRRLVLTQIGHTYPPHEIAAREIQAFESTQGRAWPKQVALAYDGLVIACSRS